MRKLFGLTEYVSLNKGDVKVGEEYLQISVVSMWDWSVIGKVANFSLDGVNYVVLICELREDGSYEKHHRATSEELTEEEIRHIENYLKRKKK